MGLLRLVDPMLAVRFRDAPPAKRRAAARVACARAAAAVGLDAPEAGAALAALGGAGDPDPALRARLDALAARLDAAHAALAAGGEPGREAEAVRAFARARVAAALALAVAGEHGDAIYEAVQAVDQPNDLPQAALEALR
jgi:hypothetical protein